MRFPPPQDLPPPDMPGTGWPFVADIPPAGGSNQPRISIVIPSLNQGRYLEAALRSVLLQGYPDLELIVMDGGSTDETVRLLRKYERWIAHWTSAADGGQSSAINKGIERSTGEVCTWIGCDDRLLPGALAHVGAHFAAHPASDWIAGAGRLEFESGRVGEMASRCRSADDLVRFWLWSNACFVMQPSSFWRRRLWDAAGGVREDLHLAMDYELWLRFAERATPVCIDAVLSVALRESGGKTFDAPLEQRLEAMRCAYDHAARRGTGALTLHAGLLRWYLEDRLRRSARHFIARRIAAGWRDLARLALAPLRVAHERGRLTMIVD